MGGFLIAVARDRNMRRVIHDPAMVNDLIGRADLTTCRADRWISGAAVVVRFHGSDRESQLFDQADDGARIAHLADQFERYTDAHLVFAQSTLRLTAPSVTWRTLWMWQDERATVVATSLRHCAFLLGGFEPDEDTPTQFLITGTLGPERSWDRRVRQLRGGESVEIDTESGRLRCPPTGRRDGASVDEAGLSDKQARAELAERIRRALASKLKDPNGWVLPLSGGHDSRGLLMLLPVPLTTITWGSAASRTDRRSDSWVAAELAAASRVAHRFIEISDETTPESALANFVAASEGRIDHIDAYADGLRSWRSLAADGVTGVVRGDECFGWVNRRTELGVRRSVGALGPNDLLENPRTRAMGDRRLLWRLARSPDESLAAWRDELYRSFRVPSVLAPLTETKANFVDVVCPLLAPDVVSLATSLRDDQRTDKRVFSELVKQLSPPVRFATRSSTPDRGFAARGDVRAMLCQRLSDDPPSMFDANLVELLAHPQPASTGSRANQPLARRIAQEALPHRVVRRLARQQLESPVALSDDSLRLRLVIADGARSLLEEWGAAGSLRRTL